MKNQRVIRKVINPFITIISVVGIIGTLLVLCYMIGVNSYENNTFCKNIFDNLCYKSGINIDYMYYMLCIGFIMFFVELITLFLHIFHIIMTSKIFDIDKRLSGLVYVSQIMSYGIMKLIVYIYYPSVRSIMLLIANYIQTPIIIVGLYSLYIKITEYMIRKDVKNKV